MSSKSQNSEFTQHTLSVSDLGTHNIISSESVYNFIDFEFFGLDSIHKLVGDFLLHPRNEFKEAEMSRFMESISKISNWFRNLINEGLSQQAFCVVQRTL